MKRKNKKFQKRGQNSLSKLSLFQKNDGKFSKKCPLSIKNAPVVDYKNVSLLKKYISDNGKTLRIASQVKALISGGGCSKDPDYVGHVGFFLWGSVLEPHTLFKNIKSFPPGSSLWVCLDGHQEKRYFASVSDIVMRSEAILTNSPSEVQSLLQDSL